MSQAKVVSVQRFIGGTGSGYTIVYDDGTSTYKPRLDFDWKVREFRRSYKRASVFGQSTPSSLMLTFAVGRLSGSFNWKRSDKDWWKRGV